MGPRSPFHAGGSDKPRLDHTISQVRRSGRHRSASHLSACYTRGVHLPIETLEGIESTTESRWSNWSRRGFIVVLAAFVLAGATGLLGVQTRTAHGDGAGWHLDVAYPRIARSGLDVTFEVTVHHEGGFGKEVRIAITGDYFDLFETQGFNPEPAEETRDARTRYLTFTAPPGETFVLSYDAYVQPAAQRGTSGTVSILDDDLPVASADVHTTLLP